jgi:hypothetical protein
MSHRDLHEHQLEQWSCQLPPGGQLIEKAIFNDGERGMLLTKTMQYAYM